MRFLRFPESALFEFLSPATTTIFLRLIQSHFHLARGEYDRAFYITDRDLSQVSGCSKSTIWKTKKILRDLHLIEFKVGLKNRTYYKILSPNGNNHKKKF